MIFLSLSQKEKEKKNCHLDLICEKLKTALI